MKFLLGKMPSGTVLRKLLALCILGFLFSGCAKDTTVPEPEKPPVVITPPTISINPGNDTTIESDGTTNLDFGWNANGNFKNLVVMLNDSVIPNAKAVGEFSIEKAKTGNYFFSVSCQATDGERVQKSSTITVKDKIVPPLPTKEDTLCNFGPWKKIKLEFQANPDVPWVEATIWDCSKDDLITFYLVPTKTVVYDNGELRCGNEPRTQEGLWTPSGLILNTGFDFNITTLKNDTLVWIYNTGGNVRETFIHPSKK